MRWKRTLCAVLAAAAVLFSVLPGMTADAAETTQTLDSAAAQAAAAAGYPVSAYSALIQGNNVVVKVQASAVPEGSDGIYHLYAQECYEAGVQGKEVAQAAAGKTAEFTFPLGKNTADSCLFRKFAVVMNIGGTLTPVSNAIYVQNPEACGKQAARYDGGGKKGFLLDPHLLDSTNYLTEAGVDQVTYNLPVGSLCDTSTGRKINYTYDGTTYTFNLEIVGQYDLIIPKMNKLGISVTLILLNNRTSSATMLHPLSRDSTTANYYDFNVADAAGLKRLEAIASFLGSRYSGAHGTVDNWIVGNEANAWVDWNYISPFAGMDTAAAEYGKAVRIFYNGIRSENANARVYACFDHEWAEPDAGGHYAAKPFLTSMAAYLSAEGNFNYGIAMHPYNVPLYAAQTWAPEQMSLTPQDQSAPYLSMANIGVLTDYLETQPMLQTDGQVRSVLCSELGYSSISYGGYTSDELQQAAALVFGYLQAANNQYIDGFFNREADAAEEISQGLALGVLSTSDYRTYRRKLSYDYYKNIDDPNEAANIMAACGSIMGGVDISLYITPR